jgi:hypothetical protein
MSQRTIDPSKLGVAGVYLLLFLLMFWPLMDWFTTVGVPRLGSVEWRYGAVGLFSAYLATPALGLGLAMVLAFLFRHVAALRVMAAFSLLLAIILLPAMGSFALDVIQVRAGRPPESLPSFHVGALIAEAKLFTHFAVFALLGLGGWTTAGDLARQERAGESKGRPGGLVGASKS